MSSQQTDAILGQLIRERDAFAVFSREKLQQMDEAIKARRATIEGFQFPGLQQPPSATVEGAPVSSDRPIDRKFSAMAYPAMVHHVLSLQPERVPLTVNGILEVMEAHGVIPESSSPRNTIKTALNRRSTKERDIVHTGLGEWGLVSWYSASELEKFERGQDGSKARDAKMHKANMKKGIAAVQARGAHYGKPPKITEEMWNLAVKLIADEGQTVAFAHKEIVKLFPDGEEPIGVGALQNRRKEFLARAPYPSSWRAYFENRKKVEAVKADIENSAPILRSIK